MSVLVNEKTRLLVPGLHPAVKHLPHAANDEYGTNVVGGLRRQRHTKLSKARFQHRRRRREATAECFRDLVPRPYAADAFSKPPIRRLQLVICITEGIPALDMVRVALPWTLRRLVSLDGTAPHHPLRANAKSAYAWARIHKRGNVGVVSRSGTLTYEAVDQLTKLASASPPASALAAIPSSAPRFLMPLDFSMTIRTRTHRFNRGKSAECGRARRRMDQVNVKSPSSLHRRPDRAAGRRMGHAGAIISGGPGHGERQICRNGPPRASTPWNRWPTSAQPSPSL